VTVEPTSDRIWTVPNAISAARLGLVGLFAALLAAGLDVWALAVLAVSSATDWLDGVLARRLGQVTRIGELLDPAADRLFIFVTILALAWRGLMPWWLVALLVLRDVLMAVVLVRLARSGWSPLQVHLAGKAGTLMLLYAFPLLLLADLLTGWWADAMSSLGWAAALWGVALYWVSGVVYVGQARSLLAEAREAQG
jgi:cardiolipin synthase (CMP-forming)